ncbi:hypothetical protein HPP92_011151 [Vanilla planifolia]|uniref:Uncharacterized protein n=1 Tax=Vanilla planifolia TaxID=51239 RepID=A0A835V0G7_VANPL|nr:hypothetical protein HPP92_011151 [Vanilla planifolia]
MLHAEIYDVNAAAAGEGFEDGLVGSEVGELEVGAALVEMHLENVRESRVQRAVLLRVDSVDPASKSLGEVSGNFPHSTALRGGKIRDLLDEDIRRLVILLLHRFGHRPKGRGPNGSQPPVCQPSP